MERLTKRVDGGVVFPNELLGTSLAPDNEYMHKLLTRLAAYEDTELEPEEIVSVQEEPWCVFYFNRRCNLDGDFCPEGPGCPQEMSPEDAVRLLKLAKAEENLPLTPEELREMGKDWVWIKLLVPHYGMNTGYYIKHPTDPDRDSFQCGYPNIWVRGLPYSLYGDNWLAYSRKPEEVSEK